MSEEEKPSEGELILNRTSEGAIRVLGGSWGCPSIIQRTRRLDRSR